MKYTIRRFAFAVITLPAIALVYGATYFGLALIASTNTATLSDYLNNIWPVGFAWVVVVTFSSQILRLVNKV